MALDLWKQTEEVITTVGVVIVQVAALEVGLLSMRVVIIILVVFLLWEVQVLTHLLVEMEHFINTYTKQDVVDIFKKNEMRFNLDYKTGMATIFFKIEMNGYVNFSLFNESQKTAYIISDKNRLSGVTYIKYPSYPLLNKIRKVTR